MNRAMKTTVAAMVPLVPLAGHATVAAERTAPLNEGIPSIVEYLQSFGTELTYIGMEGGVKGYLGKSRDGHFQTFYVMPDGRHVIAGIMSDSRGINVTGVQIGKMQERFKAAEKLADDETRLLDAKESATAESEESAELAISNPRKDSLENKSSGQFEESFKSKFTARVIHTGFFEIGSVSAPIAVWMLADPNCPFCHTAWRQLKKFTDAGKIRVRVITVAFLPGSKRNAINLLASNDPVGTWSDSQGGRHLIPKPNGAKDNFRSAEGMLRRNMEFASGLGLNGTPFLAFEDIEGRFHSSNGLPGEMAEFLELELP